MSAYHLILAILQVQWVIQQEDFLFLEKQQIHFIRSYKQVCIYAYNKSELKKFHSKCKSALEAIEDIEIIRFLELGEKVQMVKLNSGSYAVDTIKDLKKVENVIKKQNIR